MAAVGVSLREHQEACLALLKEFDRVCRLLNIPYVLFAGTLLGSVRHGGFIPWDDDLDVLMLRSDYERFLKEADSLIHCDEFYLQKEFSERWPMFFSKLRLNNTTCLETFHPKVDGIHQGVYIDIFPADSAFDSVFGRKIQFLASKVVIAKSLDRRGYETNSVGKRLFMACCRLLPMTPFLNLVRRKDTNSTCVHTFFAAASDYSKNVYPRRYFSETVNSRFEEGEYPIPAEYDKLLTILYGDYMKLPPPEARAVKKHAVLVDLTKSFEEYKEYHDAMVFDGHTRSIR